MCCDDLRSIKQCEAPLCPAHVVRVNASAGTNVSSMSLVPDRRNPGIEAAQGGPFAVFEIALARAALEAALDLDVDLYLAHRCFTVDRVRDIDVHDAAEG